LTRCYLWIHPAFHPAEAGKEYHLCKSCVAEGDQCQRKILDMDFTLNTYKRLLSALPACGYSFQTYFEFVQDTKEKAIIMRHDVDRLPANALQVARLEHEMDIGATYYFRVVSQSWDESIIREIAGLGHEIGYHYEDLSMCKGDMERAIMNFKSNLARMRKLVPVSTICMHGSPLSSIDNLDLWKRYDYKDLTRIQVGNGILNPPAYGTRLIPDFIF